MIKRLIGKLKALRIYAVISRFLIQRVWVVRKSFGYFGEVSYQPYNRFKKHLLSNRVSKEEAIDICRKLNGL